MSQNNGDETQSLQRIKRLSDVVSLINPSYWEWSFFLIFPLSLIL